MKKYLSFNHYIPRFAFMPFIITTLLISLFFITNVLAQTTVTGKIIDNKTKEPIPFVNILVSGTTQGIQTDIGGNFSLIIQAGIAPKIQISSIGYKAENRVLKTGISQTITVKMVGQSQNLSEVTVRAKKEKYRNKDNPAVALIRKVIAHRDDNRKEGLAFYQYEKYEKIQLNLSNIDEAYKNKKIFKNFQFIFHNLDTSNVTGTVSLPLYLKETIADVYFRKNPKEEKVYIKGEKKVGLEQYLDNNGVGTYINRLYEEINIYDSNISLLSVQFVSPISNLSPTFYRFVILDTLQFQGTKCVNLGFSPRNPADFAFVGNMFIALDSSFSVRKVKLGVPKNINLNFVNDILIEQAFTMVEANKLMLSQDDITIDFSLTKSETKRGIIGKRSVSFQQYVLNKPIDNTVFKPIEKNVLMNMALDRNESFWTKARHQNLNNTEANIYKMSDSIQQVPAFKRFMSIASFLLFGYKDIAGFDIGPANAFYSFNPIEGFRLRFGGRTMAKLNPKLYAETYLAYGFKDERWKGYLGLTYNLGNNSIYEFPNNYLRASYQNEIRIPGQELQFVQEDNVLLSFKRGINDKMTYNKIFRLDYRHESRSGISYELGYKNLTQEAAGTLTFERLVKSSENAAPVVMTEKNLTSSELSINVRFAPNEQFYQGKNFRTPIVNKYPIIQLRYTLGIANFLKGAYNYHNVTVRANKRFYISPIGYTDITAEAGKIFGTVPYPLLIIHRANQSYAYQLESYNLMNFLEFASDQYAAIFVDHYFNGFIFNKLPLIKKLKLREVITFKGLYGSINKNNLPQNNNALYRFPQNTEGVTLTNSLAAEPYMEVSVGIANIFKIFRLDVVKRLSYLNNPNVSEYGLRGRFKFDF
jgi:hypothetical protein